MQFFTLLLSFLLVPSFDSLGLLATSPGSFWCNRHCNGNSHRGFEPIFYPLPHTVPFYYSDLCYILSLTLSRTALFYSVTKSLAYSPPFQVSSGVQDSAQQIHHCLSSESSTSAHDQRIPSSMDPELSPPTKILLSRKQLLRLCAAFFISSQG